VLKQLSIRGWTDPRKWLVATASNVSDAETALQIAERVRGQCEIGHGIFSGLWRLDDDARRRALSDYWDGEDLALALQSTIEEEADHVALAIARAIGTVDFTAADLSTRDLLDC